MRSMAGFWSGFAVLLLGGLLVGAAAGRLGAAESPKAWLGVMMQDLDQDLREGMSYKGEGVLISGINKGSAAEKAGLQKGDVLVSVNSRSVKSSQELTDLIGAMKVDQSVSLVVMRDGTKRTLSAKLGARPENIEMERSDSMTWSTDPDVPGMDGSHEFNLEVLPEDVDIPDVSLLRGFGMGRGRLGVRTENLTKDLAPYFGSQEGSGALVIEVMKDTPAEKAGIKAGDVITQVGDEKISDAEGLARALRASPEGKVKVTATRKGARQTFEPELGPAARTFRWRGHGDAPRAYVYRRSPRGTEATKDDVRELREELRRLQEKLDRLERN